MSKLIVALFISLFISSLPASQGAPEWVVTRPVSEEWFVGIGRGPRFSLTVQPEAAARRDAFEQIAREIGITREILETFPEVTLVDRWESDDELWSYYRILRTHPRLQTERVNSAHILARSHIDEGRGFAVSGDYIDCLRSLIRAYSALYPVRDIFISDSLNRVGQNLLLETNSLVGEVFRSIQFETSHPFYRGPVSSVDEAPPIRVSWQDRNPVRSMPVEFTVIRGEGEPISVTSNDEGLIYCRFIRRPSGRELLVRVSLDLDGIVSSVSDESDIINRWLSGFSIPHVDLLFNFASVSLLYEGVEMIYEKPLPRTILEPAIKNTLSDRGYVFTTEEAPYRISVNASTLFIGEAFGIYTSQLIVTISFTDMATGVELFQESLPPIRGRGVNEEAAANQAYRRAIETVGEAVSNALSKAGF